MGQKIVVHIRNEETKNLFNRVKASLFSQRFPDNVYGRVCNTEVVHQALKLYSSNIKLIEYMSALEKIEPEKIVDIGLKYYLKKKGSKNV